MLMVTIKIIDKNNQWIGFWGSIISGFITLLGSLAVIHFSKYNTNKQIKNNNQQQKKKQVFTSITFLTRAMNDVRLLLRNLTQLYIFIKDPKLQSRRNSFKYFSNLYKILQSNYSDFIKNMTSLVPFYEILNLNKRYLQNLHDIGEYLTVFPVLLTTVQEFIENSNKDKKGSLILTTKSKINKQEILDNYQNAQNDCYNILSNLEKIIHLFKHLDKNNKY